MKLTRLPAALLVASALAFGVSGCMGSPTADDGSELVGEIERDLEPTAFMDGIIAAQQEAGSVRLELEVRSGESVAMSMKGSMVFDNGDGPAFEQTITTNGRTVAMALVAGQTYLFDPEISDEQWVHVDPADEASPLHSIAQEFAAADPMSQADDVRDAVISVESLGENEIAGVPFAHYRVTVDPGKVTGATAQQFGSAMTSIDELVYLYWLDDLGRPAKVETTIETGGVEATTIVRMRDWGEIPAFEPPPAEMVTTLEELGLVG